MSEPKKGCFKKTEKFSFFLLTFFKNRAILIKLQRRQASVAQSVEQGTENPRVIGSIPIGGTILRL